MKFLLHLFLFALSIFVVISSQKHIRKIRLISPSAVFRNISSNKIAQIQPNIFSVENSKPVIRIVPFFKTQRFSPLETLLRDDLESTENNKNNTREEDNFMNFKEKSSVFGKSFDPWQAFFEDKDDRMDQNIVSEDKAAENSTQISNESNTQNSNESNSTSLLSEFYKKSRILLSKSVVFIEDTAKAGSEQASSFWKSFWDNKQLVFYTEIGIVIFVLIGFCVYKARKIKRKNEFHQAFAEAMQKMQQEA